MDAEDRRMNQFIDFVNANKAKTELNPPIQDEHENELFDKSHKRVIAIGDDAPTDILSQLSFQGIVKTRGDFDMEYALSDIVSGYINELSSNKPILNHLT